MTGLDSFTRTEWLEISRALGDRWERLNAARKRYPADTPEERRILDALHRVEDCQTIVRAALREAP